MSSKKSRSSLSDKLARLPRTPGVYLFKDEAARVIYVGKAKDLRSRVRSYFVRSGDTRLAVRFIEKQVRDLEIIQTRNEKEAFLLENNLIKKLKPRYNIRLRDDKSFLHLRLDQGHPFPAIVPVRRPRRDGAKYFGPYASAGAIRSTLRVIRSFIPLRDCKDRELESRTRPCLKYQIKLCAAPCVGLISQEDYGSLVQEAVDILRGKTSDIMGRLQVEMQKAADALEFEKAARIRDQIAFLETSTAGQTVEARVLQDLDAVGYYREGAMIEVAVLFFRDGKLVAVSPFTLESELPIDEALSEFLSQFYTEGGRSIPEEILVPEGIYGLDVLEPLLEDRRGAKVSIRTPKRGAKVKVLEMAHENARLSHRVSTDRLTSRKRVLESLARMMGLEIPLSTIECCDISNTYGESAVGSIVRFENGEADKSFYRRFQIKSVEGADDYAMMREVLGRRLRRGMEKGDLPDLLLVDGGRGQLNVAIGIVEELGVEGVFLASIAKAPRRGQGLTLGPGEEERLFLPDRRDPVPLSPDTEECYLLQRVRDEAHRFAIEYHRKKRKKRSLDSILAGVPGLGAARAKRVMTHFGGLKGLRAASVDEIEGVPGIGAKLASAVYDRVHRSAG